MDQFLDKIISFWEGTGLGTQFADYDVAGLMTNPWFIVPFVVLVGYMVFKQKWKDMVILAVIAGVWYASGTPYMNSLIVGDELQLDKVLPVIAGGAGALALVIYLLFGKD